MPKIKFSHKYTKLADHFNDTIKTARLLGVFTIYLQEQHAAFLNYDTDNGTYGLPTSGEYMILLFQKPDTPGVTGKNLFTTLRRYTPQKMNYYMGEVGEIFDIVLN